MDRDTYYRRYKERIANHMRQTQGYYNSKPGKPLGHTFQTLRTWEIAFRLAGKALQSAPGNLAGLDVGCGRGDFTIQTVWRFPKITAMWGCDVTEEALAIARKEAASLSGISFKHGDLLALPFENNQFDLTLCVGVLLHARREDQGKALSELARVTKKYLILEIKNRENFYYGYIHRKVGGLDIFPTSVTEVKQTLAIHGFQLREQRGIFVFNVLSPIIVLLFEKEDI